MAVAGRCTRLGRTSAHVTLDTVVWAMALPRAAMAGNYHRERPRGQAPSSSISPVQPLKDAKAAWSQRERRMAASTRVTSTPRTSATAVTTTAEGVAPVRPSSRRTYVITETPGAAISFVARPAARRRAAKGGSSESASSRYKGWTSSAAANRGMKRGRGRSRPDSQTLIRAGLDNPSARARSSRVMPAAFRAARRRSPRSSGRATAAPHRQPIRPSPWSCTLSAAAVPSAPSSGVCPRSDRKAAAVRVRLGESPATPRVSAVLARPCRRRGRNFRPLSLSRPSGTGSRSGPPSRRKGPRDLTTNLDDDRAYDQDRTAHPRSFGHYWRHTGGRQQISGAPDLGRDSPGDSSPVALLRLEDC